MFRSLPSCSPRLDALGLGLVLLFALWVRVFAGGGEGRPAPVLLLLAGMVGATVAGRALASRRNLVPGAVAVGIAGSILVTWPGVLRSGGGPLGYANANATLTALGVVAALIAAANAAAATARRVWLGLAGVLVLSTVATGSAAGVLALAAAHGLVALSAVTRWAGFAVVGGLVAVSLTVGISTAVALGSGVSGLHEEAGIRGELWAAAAHLARTEPLTGIGPGRFAERNPVSTDADLRWAHHGYLQVAAENGLIGLLLLAAIFGWAWATLWTAAARRPASASLAAAAVTVVGLHGAVDYVWHLPPVLVVTGALLGTGTAPPVQRDRGLLPAS